MVLLHLKVFLTNFSLFSNALKTLRFLKCLFSSMGGTKIVFAISAKIYDFRALLVCSALIKNIQFKIQQNYAKHILYNITMFVQKL